MQCTIKDLSFRLCSLEQSMRESNLEINGIPEHKSENLVNTVLQLGNVIDHPINEEDILKATRVMKFNKESDRPRSVIVKLKSPLCRDSVIAAVTKFNKKNAKDKLSSHHLGISGARVPVFVAEHLIPSSKTLHAAARKKSKELNYKFVWVRNGRIYVRKDESCKAILIRDMDSLHLIT
ncbi:PREDICTED: uncharacterized protein LOC106113142 [Papilio xuthus]|nr:PREDICTED: uncharacterized protein LOC106113142 [Papilio xuthus]